MCCCDSPNYIFEDSNSICTNCGCTNETQNDYEFSKRQRYTRDETKDETILKRYFEKLKMKIPSKYHSKLETVFRSMKIESTFKEVKYELFARVLKFLKENSILSISLNEHQTYLEIQSKKFGKFIKENSELCQNDDIIDDMHVDPPTTDFNRSCLENIVSRLELKRSRDVMNESKQIFDTLNAPNNECETMLSLISVFKAAKRLKIKISKKDFCAKTQLTSTPTLSKFLKKFDDT